MKRIIKFLTIFSSIAIMSCKEKPLLLLDEFYSYESYAEVVGLYLNSEIILGNTDGLLYVKLPDYKHLNEEGDIRLLFYEDQLASVGFFPKDTGRYFAKVERKFRLRLPLGEELVFENLSVLKSNEWEKEICYGCRKYFVSWSDKRLLGKYGDKVW